MEIIKIAGMALTGVILAALMRTVNKDMTLYISLATSMIIIISVIGRLTEILSFIEGLYDNVDYGREFLPIIMKILAVAYITDFTAQLCKDAGEGSLGSKVEFAGKVVIFYIAIPVLTAILQLIDTLMG